MVAYIKEKDKRNYINSIKSISVNSIYRAQWDKQDWLVSIIYIERSYVNRIIQVSMDRIIDHFKKKEPWIFYATCTRLSMGQLETLLFASPFI